VIELCERLSGRSLDVRFEEAAAGDVRRTAADIGAARRDLGWEPRMPLEDGLRAQLEGSDLAAPDGSRGQTRV
jgi:nucleoside-diphosphate-sugar epimerase